MNDGVSTGFVYALIFTWLLGFCTEAVVVCYATHTLTWGSSLERKYAECP